MKQFLKIFLLAAAAAMVAVACETKKAESDLLTVSSLEIATSPVAGSTTRLTITAKYAWSISTEGNIECSLTSGETGSHSITVTTPDTSHSMFSREEGHIYFTVNGKSIGGSVVVKRNPAVTFNDSDLTLDAVSKEASFTVKAYTDFTVSASSSDLQCTQKVTGSTGGYNTYLVTVKSTATNLSMSKVDAGTLSIATDADRDNDAVKVWLQPAIVVQNTSISIGGKAGATTGVSVQSALTWQVTSTDSTIKVTKDSASQFTVTSTVDNESNAELQRGEIRVSLDSSYNTDEYIALPVYQMNSTAPQALIYFAIGTSLRSYYDANIEAAMRAIDLNILGNSRVMVFIQSSATSADIYTLRYDRVSQKAVKEYMTSQTLPDIYTAASLRDNLNNVVALCPAERYGLVLASHGNGWIPKGTSSTYSIMGVGASEEDIWRRADTQTVVRNIGDSATRQYNVQEVIEALSGCTAHFDYILFDACFMSCIESLYDLRNSTDYIISSPCEVMGMGFPYEQVLPLMMQNDGTSHDLDAICKAYVDYYNTQNYKSACVSLTDCSKLESVATAAKAALASQTTVNLSTVQFYDGLTNHIFYDLEDIIRTTCTDTSKVEEFKTALAQCVTSRYHTDAFYSVYNAKMNAINYYSGIGTSDGSTVYPTLWKQTAWYKATH